MQICKPAVLSAIFVICILDSSCRAQKPEQPAQNLGFLEFAEEVQIGHVDFFEREPVGLLSMLSAERMPARGTVKIPGEFSIGLSVGTGFEADVLNGIPESTVLRVERLSLYEIQLDAQALTAIGRFRNLTQLRLERCEIASDAFDLAPALPNLKNLTVSSRNSSKAHLGSLANWSAKLSELQYLYATPSLDALTVQAMQGHKSITTLRIEVAKDRQAIIFKMLDGLPSLETLILDVSEDVSSRSLDRIASVKQLESLTLVRARVDGAMLDKLSGLENLKELRLLVISPGDDFHENLLGLTALENLYVSTGLWEDDRKRAVFESRLQETQLELPGLKEYTKLQKFDQNKLKAILAKPNIESLGIDGIDPGFELRQLEKLANLRQLKSLKLSWVPISDDQLRSISKLENLEYLSLVQTEVLGPGLKHLEALPKLERLQLMMDTRRGPHNLAPIKSLKGLKRIQVFGFGFEPRDFLPIADSRSIQELVLSEGKLDDSVIGRLAAIPSLKTIQLMDTQATDESLKSLSGNAQLESIFIDGDITREGVEQLMGLTRLSRIWIDSTLFDESAESLGALFPAAKSKGFRKSKR